ncbi:porin [Hydrogenophaga sp. PBL-H3]|uniref:porin n=1 Tax=Hydrogenophaga sp. PBL-H3 TaxID=434010 RepID=UPI00132033D8|nr:porin [Hydrogenophaga sp. PBL-H3]QHE77615.1 porin [Hydrogenophaga sp. PBL-H3]QHE82039.1 porin [Hydrogenophaga sp. PBL-H3]
MKKSLIALAILGSVAGVAQAQSTVTLYGIADVWLGSEKDGLNAKSVAKVNSGGFNGSRFGLTGSEDLGGGLKAVFKLEQGFAIDTGTQSAAGTAFGRQAYVGLAGGFGTVTFGNVWSSMDDVLGASNGAFDSAFSPAGLVNGVNTSYVDRPKNAIKYQSPSFGGFSGGFTYGLDENTAVSQDVVDFSLSYGAGPVGVNFAYQVQNGVTDTKLTHLGGSYDLGVAKLLASYGQVKEDAAKTTDYQFGVDVPLSSALTLSGSYARSKDNAFLGSSKRDGFGIAAKYSLSKRTFTYAGVVSGKQKDAAGVKNDEYRLYAVGMQHSF